MEKQNDLKEALEYQIDIVLKLEQERLKLLKENKYQKQKITELSNMMQKYTRNLNKDSDDMSTQTFQYIEDKIVQTEDFQINDESIINNEFLLSSLCSSAAKQQVQMLQTQSSEVDQNTMLNYSQSQFIEKNNTISAIQQARDALQKMNQTQKFNDETQKSINQDLNKKSNKKNNESITKEKSKKMNDQEVLAQELVRITKENTQLRTLQRSLNNDIKQFEKENFELHKTIDIKNQNLEKLRHELSQMSIALNDDSFKSVRMIEEKLQNQTLKNKKLKQDLEQNKQVRDMQEQELNQCRDILVKLTNEYEEMENKLNNKNQAVNNDTQNYEKKFQILQEAYNSKQQETELKQKMLDEQIQENQKLYQDIDYFKNIAKTAKNHAEKALRDVDFYQSQYNKFKNNQN